MRVRRPGMIDPGEQVRVRVIQPGQLSYRPDLPDRAIRLRHPASQHFELADLPFDIRSGYALHAALPVDDHADVPGAGIQAGKDLALPSANLGQKGQLSRDLLQPVRQYR